MRERTILKIALISSLVGVVLLYFISTTLNVNEYSALNSNLGDNVKLKGNVKGLIKGDKATVIEVEQIVPSKVVVYDKDVNLTLGDFIEVIGEIDEYKGKEEIIANRIRVIK